MSASIDIIRQSIRGTAMISPTLAARIARRFFFRTTPRMALHERDSTTDMAARRTYLQVRGRDVATYEWGSGERTVLLLHGWQGRASQFAPLVRELVAAGCHVVSFDAPAHGASGGRRTDIRDWLDVSSQLARRYGRIDAIVGHSLGGLAALIAARNAIPVRSVVVVAGAVSPSGFLAEFSGALRLDPATHAHFERLSYVWSGATSPSGVEYFDAVANPLPPDTELFIVHDRKDRKMPDTDSLRLHAAHEERSRMMRTSGFGHTRVLSADPVLDAVVALVTDGLRSVDVSDARTQVSRTT